MKHLSVFIFLIHFALLGQKQNIKEYTVSGKVTQSSAYCGGMRPSEEMLNELTKSKPYAGKIFYVKKGKSNDAKQKILMKIVLDSSGHFSFHLPPGNYVLLLAEQLKPIDFKALSKLTNITYDKTCVQQWWQKAYLNLEIKDKNIEDLQFHFQHPCFISGDMPCLTYTGPMPP